MKKILILIISSFILIWCNWENPSDITNFSDENLKINANIEKDNNKLIINWAASWAWFFEASFPIMLEDDNSKVISKSIATASWNWMTSDYVEFNSELNYSNPETEYWYIIFQNDNPSGLEENKIEKKIKIKITD